MFLRNYKTKKTKYNIVPHKKYASRQEKAHRKNVFFLGRGRTVHGGRPTLPIPPKKPLRAAPIKKHASSQYKALESDFCGRPTPPVPAAPVPPSGAPRCGGERPPEAAGNNTEGGTNTGQWQRWDAEGENLRLHCIALRSRHNQCVIVYCWL